ncbi:hypothetical protein BG60_26650 [Caballeronia zhejiangensis]|uniref:Uncharacterized protein n=1 Tax=Caballeronia zhejiangensis TaxID=871203 RepID=A0A656QCG5_9BURK|nr:hypothetical protein BG60_26650 [Caballeronia zhejiangensis]
MNDRQALLIWQKLEEFADVAASLFWLVVQTSEELFRVANYDMERFTPCSRAKEIHQLVARNGVQLSRQRFVQPVGVTSIVDCKQNLLS